MNVEDLKWIVGLFVTSVGGIVLAFRNVHTKHSTAMSELHKKIDSVKDKSVQKDELTSLERYIDQRFKDHAAANLTRHEELKSLIRAKER